MFSVIIYQCVCLDLTSECLHLSWKIHFCMQTYILKIPWSSLYISRSRSRNSKACLGSSQNAFTWILVCKYNYGISRSLGQGQGHRNKIVSRLAHLKMSWPGTSFLVCKYNFAISRWSLHNEVIGSRAQEQCLVSCLHRLKDKSKTINCHKQWTCQTCCFVYVSSVM